MGWKVFGRKELEQFRLDTSDNPSDDPSREVELRAPKPQAEWMAPLLEAGGGFLGGGRALLAARHVRLEPLTDWMPTRPCTFPVISGRAPPLAGRL